MPFGASHAPIVALSGSAITAFFRKIEVYGSENVPQDGPIIFACTHTNMAIDPAVLSNTVPHQPFLHYWVKDSLFKNPAMKVLLTNAGNIPVDRKNKNNQHLFRGTFEVMAQGECLGVFPEGTSHTEPHLIPMKDGVSWAAMEYLAYLRGTEENQGVKDGKPAMVVPVGIAYCDKNKYRSRVVVTYGPVINPTGYAAEFFSDGEGSKKSAVKRLTKSIELEMYKMTVNAPDWDSSFSAEMARQLLWREDLPLSDFVDVAQTLVDVFATRDPRIDKVKATLVAYRRLLFSSRLTNDVLTDLPLPKALDPSADVPLPGRLRTLATLVAKTIISLIQFPLFVIPFLTHLPLYIIGILGAGLAEHELETQAQMKVFLGCFFSILWYPILFFILRWVFWTIPLGMALAASAVWLLSKYHSALIDQNYQGFKRLTAAWRILVGVWVGPKAEMSMNKFLDGIERYAPNPPAVAGLPPGQERQKYVRPEHLPSRVLVRHVLRQRVIASRELASLLLSLENDDTRLKASFWLAERYGGDVFKADPAAPGVEDYERDWPRGVRGAREVVAFLRGRGARLGSAGADERWAASEDEVVDKSE